MKQLSSITYRITGLTFAAIAITVVLLIYLANVQMIEQFQEYLTVQQAEMAPAAALHHGLHTGMGPMEYTFLASVHRSLIWVGLGILLIGLAASFWLARSITVPLRNLSRAAQEIERGNLSQRVLVETRDEVGQLAEVFNHMAASLAAGTEERRRLLANIAHELRTPLAIIQGNLEGMMDGVIETDESQLASLYEEAARLNLLIRDLRDLSLAEAGQLRLDKETLDINQWLQRALGLLKPLAEEKQAVFACCLAAGLPVVQADRNRLNQVLYNILVNAIRYSPAGGTITVSTALTEAEDRQWLCIAVADEGEGIAAEDMEHIFEHFYRGDKSRDRKSGGSGLGLAVVRQLVEIHGGRVSVVSQPGQGSVFTVLLPASQEMYS